MLIIEGQYLEDEVSTGGLTACASNFCVESDLY